MKALIAYCYNKSFGPYSIPVKFQNIICRDYVQKLNLIFGPGQGEPIFSKNFFTLKSMIKEGKKNYGIVMLSLYMLPKKKKKD
jgi:sporadic carbohydrate cluster protein (TIGR04323 family)